MPGDQILIVGDGSQPAARQMVLDAHLHNDLLHCPFCGQEAELSYFEYDSGYHWLGVEQINWLLRTQRIKGSHVLLMGDDDIYVPGALAKIRRACEVDMLQPVIFSFLSPWREILPPLHTHHFQKSRISGCCMAAPTRYVGLHTTEKIVEHDYYWMADVISRAAVEGHDPTWFDECLVIARPDDETDSMIDWSADL
jgi:hypothetical protein